MSADPVSVDDPSVLALVDALTAELAQGGYGEEGTFGYSAEQLRDSGVHLVGVRVDGHLVAIGGVELQGSGVAELKRMYVDPAHRGTGIADQVVDALLDHARTAGVTHLRLETGDQQHAALAFYRRRGFVEVDRFPPYTESTTSVCMELRLS